MPRADSIPAFNRRRDRKLNGYIYISDVELQEQGIVAEPVDLVGRYIVYNGNRVLVEGASNDGILLGKTCVVTDAMFCRTVDGRPTYRCPCGKHTVDAEHYAFCTHGLGRVYYDIENRDAINWFRRQGKQHLLIGG